MSTCLCRPACVHLRVSTCLCRPACVHLLVSTCLCRPACVDLLVSTCLCRPACVHLRVSTCLCRPACVHLLVSTCLCRPACVDLHRSLKRHINKLQCYIDNLLMKALFVTCVCCVGLLYAYIRIYIYIVDFCYIQKLLPPIKIADDFPI